MIYNPSSATRQITIAEIEYSTFLNINAAGLVDQGAPFPISGRLTFMEGGVEYGLGGRSIALSYNGTSLGSATTDGSGNYSKSVTINSSGSFTLKAAFAGGSGLAASSASMGIQIGVTSPVTLLLLALGAYYLLRK